MAIYRMGLLVAALFPSAVFPDDILTVAVASNYHSTAREIAVEFTKRTDIPVRISSASTGVLFAQIVNGAPYDVFLAADTERPKRLVTRGLAIAETVAVYALGQLVLFSTDPELTGRNCLGVFEQGNFSRLAIANPKTAPYGRAAIAYLESAELFENFAGKLVFGENIAQAFQFVATGNTRFGLIARSQATARFAPKATCSVPLGGEPVAQSGVVLSASKNRAAAIRFMHFLQSPVVCALTSGRGYSVPDSTNCESN